MVRFKERYLLVNILYPEAVTASSKGNVPDLVLYNQPTTDRLTPQSLAKGIRLEVASLFGDCGSGAIERSLQGTISDKSSLRGSHRL
jgi:ribonuclease P/MRP protein subunit POP5